MFFVASVEVPAQQKKKGLVKSCEVMCASAVAAKDRRKRLSEGKHPYKEYTYDLVVLGRVGDTWEGRENLLDAGGEVAVVGLEGSADPCGLPPVLDRCQAEEHIRYLAEEEALGEHLGEDEDPIGFGSGFDAP